MLGRVDGASRDGRELKDKVAADLESTDTLNDLGMSMPGGVCR